MAFSEEINCFVSIYIYIYKWFLFTYIYIYISARIMMFLLILSVSIFNVLYSLECLHNCSMTYSLDEPFILPMNCSYISTNRCSVKLIFWYEHRNYIVTFPGDFLNDQILGDDRQFLMIQTTMNTFFSYDFNHVCKDRNDCARLFAEKKIFEMRQRLFNISNIYSDLQRILYKKSTVSEDLICFDTNEAVRQCAVPGIIGSCQIIDDLVKYKLHRRSCQRSTYESASINIYDSGNFAMMTVKCNRMLCNGPLTVEAVKKVLNHHNITDINGRLPGNSSRLSYLYLIFLFQYILYVILIK